MSNSVVARDVYFLILFRAHLVVSSVDMQDLPPNAIRRRPDTGGLDAIFAAYKYSAISGFQFGLYIGTANDPVLLESKVDILTIGTQSLGGDWDYFFDELTFTSQYQKFECTSLLSLPCSLGFHLIDVPTDNEVRITGFTRNVLENESNFPQEKLNSECWVFRSKSLSNKLSV